MHDGRDAQSQEADGEDEQTRGRGPGHGAEEGRYDEHGGADALDAPRCLDESRAQMQRRVSAMILHRVADFVGRHGN